MDNSQMAAGRFERWALYRKAYARIKATLESGGSVVLATYTRATEYKPKHLELFSVSRTGLYVQHGKQRLCLNPNIYSLRFYVKRGQAEYIAPPWEKKAA